ncbi:MAG: Fur family ferric uptake transcriptional regulator [Pirellulaceae bacterium]|jgi:Fur family ferric uptake transcriptional regulator
MSSKRDTQLSVEAAKVLLRGVRLRCTAARIAIVQRLADASTPASPAELAGALSAFGFDKSTIYRSLTELHEAGLVVRLDLGDSIRRYELLAVDNTGSSEHAHFMCVNCGQVQCLSHYRFELTGDDASDPFPGSISEVFLKGHCESCR